MLDYTKFFLWFFFFSFWNNLLGIFFRGKLVIYKWRQLYFFLSDFYALYFLSCLTSSLARNSSTVLTKDGKWTSCLIPGLRKGFIFSLMEYNARCRFYRSGSSISVFLRISWVSVGFVRCFSASIDMVMHMFNFSLMNRNLWISLIIECQNQSYISEVNPVVYGI